MNKNLVKVVAIGLLVLTGSIALIDTAEARNGRWRRRQERKAQNQPAPAPATGGSNQSSSYPVHSDITTTWFYVGEGATADSGYIPNVQSAWDGNWAAHFGGIDDPKNRNGYYPAGFTPKENPFYVALPYNNFTNSNAADVMYWDGNCKNRWIKIMANGKTAYGQWEDVGPWLSNDAAYVFGTAAPKNTNLSHAGLDVSPAIRDYLGLGDVSKTSWQFVDEGDVPSGPWKNIVTTSGPSW